MAATAQKLVATSHTEGFQKPLWPWPLLWASGRSHTGSLQIPPKKGDSSWKLNKPQLADQRLCPATMAVQGTPELTKCQPGLWPPRQGLTSLAKLIRAKQVSDSTRKGLLWPVSPHLTKPAEGYFVVEYILSIKLAKKRFGGIAKGECREKIHAIYIHLGFHDNY